MLLNYTLKLREMGKVLETERPHVNQIKGYSGWKKRRTFNRKIRVFETKSLLAEKEFRILEKEADYYKKVEPLKYTVRLVLGIICFFLTLNWIASMYYLIFFNNSMRLECLVYIISGTIKTIVAYHI